MYCQCTGVDVVLRTACDGAAMFCVLTLHEVYLTIFILRYMSGIHYTVPIPDAVARLLSASWQRRIRRLSVLLKMR
jgi:hypothetical protein